MSLDLTSLKSLTLDALKEYLAATGAAWKDEYQPYLDAIAADGARYGAALLAGEPTAEQNLRHVKVQLQMLGAIAYGKEAQRAIETLEAVGATVIRILVKALL